MKRRRQNVDTSKIVSLLGYFLYTISLTALWSFNEVALIVNAVSTSPVSSCVGFDEQQVQGLLKVRTKAVPTGYMSTPTESCLSFLSSPTECGESATVRIAAATTAACTQSTSKMILPNVSFRIRQTLYALSITLPPALFTEYGNRRSYNHQQQRKLIKKDPISGYHPQQLYSTGIKTMQHAFSSKRTNHDENQSPSQLKAATTTLGPLYVLKTGLAGGIAGAVGTTVLYPFDAAKTLRQANPGKFPSVLRALYHLLLVDQDRYHYHIASGTILGNFRFWNFGRVYKGLWASALGSIPSSALYFGAYESCKVALWNQFQLNRHGESDNNKESFYQRLLVHGCAAAMGNIVSSAIFVPKELIKSKMQYLGTQSFTRTIQLIVAEKGVSGLYCGYKAVLMRNIPTAALRFCLYEEFRRALVGTNDDYSASSTFSWKLFLAGACAGAVASGFMTPVDVIKTRVSTGFCSIESGILGCATTVITDSGWKGLYAGAGSRIFFSAAFSGIGFGTFEATKKLMGLNTKNKNQIPADASSKQ